jgi:uncharacterized protein involved in type VI secretion and phage assembly
MDGVYPATVVSVQDPESLGRVRIALPSTDGSARPRELWARLATLMAGAGRGTWFVPDVNDEVLVAFEAGDVRRPYVVGALWNPKSPPPARMDAAGENNLKMLRSRSGITITIDDTDGAERLAVATPAGQSLTMTAGADGIEIADGSGTTIRIRPSGIAIAAAAQVTVQASQITMDAGAVTINAGAVTCSGVLRAATVITNSVVSASYTPGAGNIW